MTLYFVTFLRCTLNFIRGHVFPKGTQTLAGGMHSKMANFTGGSPVLFLKNVMDDLNLIVFSLAKSSSFFYHYFSQEQN